MKCQNNRIYVEKSFNSYYIEMLYRVTYACMFLLSILVILSRTYIYMYMHRMHLYLYA